MRQYWKISDSNTTGVVSKEGKGEEQERWYKEEERVHEDEQQKKELVLTKDFMEDEQSMMRYRHNASDCTLDASKERVGSTGQSGREEDQSVV